MQEARCGRTMSLGLAALAGAAEVGRAWFLWGHEFLVGCDEQLALRVSH